MGTQAPYPLETVVRDEFRKAIAQDHVNDVADINITILVGTLTRPPRFKSFESSPSITSLEIQPRSAEHVVDSVVRVTWFDAPHGSLDLEEGAHVAVIGRVRRYWFGGNQSITDIVADHVIAEAVQS